MNLNSPKRRSGLSILSGLMLYACFYPVNLGEIAWLALAPLMLAVMNATSRKQVLLYSFLAGGFFYIPALQWMRVAHPAMYATWIALSLYCTFYLILVMLSVRYFVARGIPLWLCAPMLFTLTEFVRSHFPTGFSFLEPLGLRTLVGFGWYHLGYSQKSNELLMQMADATGVYGISWLIVLGNSIVALWIQRYAMPEASPLFNRRGMILATIGAALMILGGHLYGLGVSNAFGDFRRGDHPSLQIALVQTNLPQDIKNARGKDMVAQFIELGDEANKFKPDLIVWPETSIPDPWFDSAPGVQGGEFPDDWKEWQNKLRGFLLRRFNTNLLVGLNGMFRETPERIWKYNSALFLDRNGTDNTRYDKMHLVPFGEYVPLRETFPWMSAFTPYDHDYSCRPGQDWTRFALRKEDKTYRFAALICYEDSDASLAREAVARARAADEPLNFLVNISNDGWFDGTSEHEEHLNICRFRAIETRTAIVRAVNMGISAIIHPDGSFQIPRDSIRQSKKTSAVMDVKMPIYGISKLPTIYVRYGDWVPGLCLLANVAFLAFVGVRFSRR